MLTNRPTFTCTEIRLRVTANQIFKQGFPFVFEYAINKTYKKLLDTNLLIIYHQRRVSAV